MFPERTPHSWPLTVTLTPFQLGLLWLCFYFHTSVAINSLVLSAHPNASRRTIILSKDHFGHPWICNWYHMTNIFLRWEQAVKILPARTISISKVLIKFYTIMHIKIYLPTTKRHPQLTSKWRFNCNWYLEASLKDKIASHTKRLKKCYECSLFWNHDEWKQCLKKT